VRLAGTPLALFLLGLSVTAQGGDDIPANDPSLCPYCHGDPQWMDAAGIRSHGGFEFATTDTAGVDRILGTTTLHWIESAHFEIGLGIGTYKPKQDEIKGLRTELEELALVLPEIPVKPRFLDPWLRVHLYAYRAEKVWDRFLERARLDEKVFPAATAPKYPGTPYYGEGPYLGQKGKYELLVLPTKEVQVMFLRDQFGLGVEQTQRWNVIERDTLIAVMSLTGNDLRQDAALHGHVGFNLTALMLDGFKHYSYDVPRWLTEAMAHAMEREINPRFNTYDKSEGAEPERSRKYDWDKEARLLVASGKAPRLAQLANVRTFAEFDVDDHYVMWSMMVFLQEVHPEALACLLGNLKGRRDASGMPDASDLFDVQRDLFRTCLDMTYAQFDEAWQAWALARE